MPILDTIRTAVGPVLESAEGAQRQVDDTPGGGSLDETQVPAEVLWLSPVTGATFADDVRNVDQNDTTVHDFGVIYNRTAGDAENVRDAVQTGINDLGAGVTGDGGDGPLGTLGRAIRWAGENPLLVLGGLLLLYLAPLLTNLTGIAAGVADGG